MARFFSGLPDEEDRNSDYGAGEQEQRRLEWNTPSRLWL